jgi:hypothetical protein
VYKNDVNNWEFVAAAPEMINAIRSALEGIADTTLGDQVLRIGWVCFYLLT